MTDIETLTGMIIEGRTPDQWAQVIRADLGHAVAGFVAAGQHLAQVKASKAVPHGEWEDWCRKDVGIDPSTAVRLMSLPKHPVISNPAHGQDLPPSWRTL